MHTKRNSKPAKGLRQGALVSSALVPVQNRAMALQGAAADDELLAQYADWLELQVRARDITEDTARNYRAGIRRFVAWRATWPTFAPVLAASSVDLQTWKSEALETCRPGSVSLWLAGVRSFFGWAVAAGWATVNPADGVRGAKRVRANQAHTRDALPEDMARALLQAPTHPRDGAIIALMLFCAMRGVEVRRADYEHLGTRGNSHILKYQGKGHQEADEIKVIPYAAWHRLSEWLEIRGRAPGPLFCSLSNNNGRGRLSMASIRAIVTAAMRSVGAYDKDIHSTHSLRHTAVTQFLRQGGSLRQAQTLAGHVSPNTTAIYAHEINRVEDAPEDKISYG